jgi:hypothetical protein
LPKHYNEFGKKRIENKKFVPFSSRSLKTHIKAHSIVVRITHPAHPLRGQSFAIVQHQRKENRSLIEIQLADGECRLVPLEWTDQVPPVVTLPGARFLLANLLSVRQRLDELLPGSKESGILPRDDAEIEGGSDDTLKPGHLGQADRSATRPDHCHFGADPSASTGERQKVELA